MSLVGFGAQNHRQQVGKRGALDKVDDRRTPRELWDPLNEEFRFTLDVAASAENALCKDFYTVEDDGLEQPWHGSVWCNPPYSDCGAWVRKAHLEWVRPSVRSIVMLLPANRCEQRWWQEQVESRRDRIGAQLYTRFLPGRLRFDTPDHDYSKRPKGNRPPFGCVLVIWRDVRERREGGMTAARVAELEARVAAREALEMTKRRQGEEQKSCSYPGWRAECLRGGRCRCAEDEARRGELATL